MTCGALEARLRVSVKAAPPGRLARTLIVASNGQFQSCRLAKEHLGPKHRAGFAALRERDTRKRMRTNVHYPQCDRVVKVDLNILSQGATPFARSATWDVVRDIAFAMS